MDSKKLGLNTIRWLSLFAAVVLAGCVMSPVKSAGGEVDDQLSIEVENNTAYLSGVLGSDLVKRLSDFVKENPNVTELVLVDIPGSVDQQATLEGARLLSS